MSEIHALSGAYAVDALDDHERELFERHLADCADCRAEVASLREAAATLPESTPASPPPALRDSVLAGIRTVRPLPPLPTSVAAERARTRRPLWRNPSALLAAAAAVVAIGGAVMVTQPWDDEARAPSAAERVIEADDAREVTVKLDGATATLFHSPSQGRAALVTDDLPAPPAGKVYELWLQKDGVMVPAGLMPAGEDQEFLLSGDTSGATAAGITVEPAGGSDEPTTTPIALFELEQTT